MPSYNPEKHRRHSLRQPGKDYAQAGLYFVTINTHERSPLFGEIRNKKMYLSEGGAVVEACWLGIPGFYPSVVLHTHAVMPDHFHGLIELQGPSYHEPPVFSEEPGQHHFQAIIPKSLGAIIRGFKAGVTKWYRIAEPEKIIWQRNFHEVEIRDARHYEAARDYILNNPAEWGGSRGLFLDSVGSIS